MYYRPKSLVAWKTVSVGAGALISTRTSFKTGVKGARRTIWSNRASAGLNRVEANWHDEKSIIKQKVQIYFTKKRAQGNQAKATRLNLKHGQSIL